MQVSSFLRSRTFKVSLLVVAVVVVSVVAIKSQTAAPSLSSANQKSDQKLLKGAAGLSVNSASAATLGESNNAGSIQGQSNALVQPSGQMQPQADMSPQTSSPVEQAAPTATDVQMPADPVRPHSTSSALKGTVSIRNTGSTNTSGWTLSIYTDGSGALSYASGASNSSSKQYGSGYFDVNKLADLIANVGSMSSLQPSSSVMKSASFGTSEYATYSGSTSGDLEAGYSGTSSATQQLHSYLLGLIQLANPGTAPRMPM